jgi:hypothetical protein
MKLPLLASCAVALTGFAADLHAQAIQLPTFHNFSVSTAVSVPDRGGAYLGGVNRAASGSVSRGIPFLSKAPGVGRWGGSRAIGSTIGSSGVGVTATIIDHRELDAAVLAEARGQRAAAGDAALRTRAGPRYNLAPAAPPAAGVAEIRRRNAEQDKAAREEVLALIAKGRQAESAGKAATARIYYQMAARRADEPLRRRIEAHLQMLSEARMAAAP